MTGEGRGKSEKNVIQEEMAVKKYTQFLGGVLVLIFLKAEPKTNTWVHVVYF